MKFFTHTQTTTFTTSTKKNRSVLQLIEKKQQQHILNIFLIYKMQFD